MIRSIDELISFDIHYDNDEKVDLEYYSQLEYYNEEEEMNVRGLLNSIPFPYVREYKNLTEAELELLIKYGIENNWEAIDLSDCGISSLPDCIKEFKTLKKISLNRVETDIENTNEVNSFREFPEIICNLENLEYLAIYGMQISTLPDELSKLKKLKWLNLNSTELATLPDIVYKMEKLEFLACGIQNIEIDDRIQNLKELKRLYIPKSNFMILPNKLCNLKKLESIYLNSTMIESLPSSIQEIKTLKYINIDNTPLSKQVPPEILNQTSNNIIDFVVRMQTDENKIFLNESKMLIVGQGGVGKSCLINRLLNDKFDDMLSTEGIDISEWEFEHDANRYKLNVWDFGGQEIYHSTHQFFLTRRSLYILVWDARQEEEYGRLDYWLNTIETYAGNSPIIIVINKCDQRKRIAGIGTDRLLSNFTQIVNFHKVSCRDGDNIETLKNEVINETINLPLMGTVWFTEWLAVRSELEKLSVHKHIIDYSEFREICIDNNVTESEMNSLSKYLHDLGIILHFKDDLLLRNSVILSPEWGTDAVYKVLDSYDTYLSDKNGILNVKYLPLIWSDNKKYPEYLYPIIIRLMEKFQLSFQIDNNNYLIAELLDNNEIVVDHYFEYDKTFSYRFQYAFLPTGIMTRLIVKLHKYLYEVEGKKSCWKNGGYFKNNMAIAKVQLFDGITERYISIKVSSDDLIERQELLWIIRSGIDDIHKSIPKISCDEYIQCNCSHNCNYLHDTSYLKELASEKIEYERCRISKLNVNVKELINGYQTKIERRERTDMSMVDNKGNTINIDFNPVMIQKQNNENSNTTDIEITIEVKNSMNEMRSDLAELNNEFLKLNYNAEEEIESIKNKLKQLSELNTKEDIVDSGCLNKIKRFLLKFSDGQSEHTQKLNRVKDGYTIIKGLAINYNLIAQWCGLPVIPSLLTEL